MPQHPLNKKHRPVFNAASFLSCSVLPLIVILLFAAQAWGRDAVILSVTDNGDGTHTITAYGEFAYCPDYPPGVGTDYGHLYVRYMPPPPYPQTWYGAGSTTAYGNTLLSVTRNNYHGTTIYQAFLNDCEGTYYGEEESFNVDLTPESCIAQEPSGEVGPQFNVVGSATFAPVASQKKGYLKAYIERENGTYQTYQITCYDLECTLNYSCSRTPRCEPYHVYFVAKSYPNNLELQSNVLEFTSCPEETPDPDPDGEPGTDDPGEPPDGCNQPLNSFAEARGQSFHEEVAIPGTDLELHYSSRRTPGYKQVLMIPSSGEDVPCCRILNQVGVSDRTLVEVLDPDPHQTGQVAWDGLDGCEQPVYGAVTATVSVGYDYSLDGTAVRWKHTQIPLYIPRPTEGFARGWSISVHHHMDPSDPLTLYKGDGTRITNPGGIDPAILDALGGDIAFAEDNGLVHVFSSSGRHERTMDQATGTTLYTFGYDGENRLVSITDRFGVVTSIERDLDGVLTGIVSPDGIKTGLTVDANGDLAQVALPDGGQYGYDYDSTGLLITETGPEGNLFGHDYDENGRLIEATDEEEGQWQFSKEAGEEGTVVYEVTTGEGNTTSYVDHLDDLGQYTSVISSPTGAETEYSRSSDGTMVSKTLPCGLDLSFEYDTDPQYGYKSLTEMHESTPASLERVTLRQMTCQDTNEDDVPDRITETVTVNGKATTSVDNTLQGQELLTSPEGRTVTTVYNPATLLTSSVQIPGLYNTSYGYDARGRLTSITANTRQTILAYNAQGFLGSVTDPESETTTYTYDDVGRITGIDPPDTPLIEFEYDDNGNLTVLTTPGGIDHTFGYSQANLRDSYTPPLSGAYSYTYDKDRRLTQITFPSTDQINYIYSNIRLSQIQTPEGNIDFTYLCDTKVGSVTKGTESVIYGYDGPRMTSEEFEGTLDQTLTYTYNDDFLVEDLTYAGTLNAYGYDDDDLLISSGSFSISRNAGNGLPESVTGGTLSLSRSFNGHGEPDAEDFTVDGTAIASWEVNSRDLTGRVLTETETISGTDEDYVYTYDAAGRLLTVTKDETLVEEYQYWSDGTRSYEMNALRGIQGRTFDYDNENHLLSAGSVTYQYNVDGFLTDKIQGLDTTEYVYSSRGELLAVDLPSGMVIEYIHDPLGRRIAKKVDDVVVEKYLWEGLTRLLAVYDENDALVMRFEYADGRMPVAMTRSGTTYYLSYDQVGSLRIVADASATVIKRIDYDTFGNVIADTNPTFEVPFGFAGGLHDRDTALVRFGFRDYDPDVGRWTAKDPIGFAGGDTDLYGYCLNDPVNWVDPEGLWYIDVNVSIGSGLGVTFGVQISDTGVYGYYGGGFMSNSGVAVTASADDPCEGWQAAIQGGYYAGGQWGTGFSNGDDRFSEYGFVTPGLSITGYRVSKLFDW